MKNPNGYGSISKMTDRKRRKPYRVRVTSGWKWDDEREVAKQVQNDLGTFKTRPEAVKALAVYNADPYDVEASKTTFAEIYNLMWGETFGRSGKSMQYSMRAAFKHCAPVHDKPIGNIKKLDYKRVFGPLEGKSSSTINNVKILIGKIYEYCNEEAEMRLKNYAQKISVDAAEQKPRDSFTKEQVQKIWDNLNLTFPKKPRSKYDLSIPMQDILIIMSYTSMRISELLELKSNRIKTDDTERLYIDLSGTKTENAVRLIPVHKKIVPLVQARLDKNYEYLITDKNGLRIPYGVYYPHFLKIMKTLDIDKTSHECRHTFATFAKRSGMDEYARKLITGHSIQDFTDRVYTHYNLEDLQKEMDKLVIL